MVLDAKIQKIQSCEHVKVPGGVDKQGPTVPGFYMTIHNLFLKWYKYIDYSRCALISIILLILQVLCKASPSSYKLP